MTLQEVANACNETFHRPTGIEFANRELREAVLLVCRGTSTSASRSRRQR